MLNQRYRPLVYGLVAVVAVWLVAWAGFSLARSSKVTAEKVRTYLRTVDLSKLSGAERAKVLRKLADQLNALSYEERRQARLDREWRRWFEAMTADEKGSFIEATMPTGVKQMMASFEQLPVERRRRAIEDSLKRLREAQQNLENQEPDQTASAQGTNAPPPLSEELQRKIATTGLRTFYTESSAQTRAELAPILEELQRTMESGRLFHRPH
jgi:hypothetical protein